jgi:hypothetical protein
MRGVVFTLSAVVLLLPAIAGAVSVDREFHESFDALEGDVVVCRFGDGDVRVVPWDRETIDVHVVYRVEVKGLGLGEEPDFAADIRRVGGEIIIEGTEMPGSTAFVFIRNVHEYVYTVRAPMHVALELSGDDGDVTVDGRAADVSVRIDDGDVRLRDIEAARVEVLGEDGDVALSGIRGDIVVRCDDGDVVLGDCAYDLAMISVDDGDVSASGCDGRLEISVDDGDVSVLDAVGDLLEVTGSDGDVRIELGDVEVVDLLVGLDDGDIDVVLGRDVSAGFLATTDDGTLDIATEGMKDLKIEEERASGTLGEGGGRIRLSTDGGDITVRRRAGG